MSIADRGMSMVRRTGKPTIFDQQDVEQEFALQQLRGMKTKKWQVFYDMLRDANHYRKGRVDGKNARDHAIYTCGKDCEPRMHEMPPEIALEHADTCRFVMECLTRKERDIIYRRFWLDESLIKIGKALHVSDSRICQVIAESLRKMRRTLRRSR